MNENENTNSASTAEKQQWDLLEFKTAIETRNFEIELFWKRSNFFWLFTGGSFVALYTVQSQPLFQIIITNIGLFCTVCWTLVNRGSRFWMQSWELKAGEWSDDFAGHHENTPKDWWSYRYSVSKLMILISDFFTLIWFLLFIRLYLLNYVHLLPCEFHKRDFIPPLTLICIFIVFSYGLSDNEKQFKKPTQKP